MNEKKRPDVGRGYIVRKQSDLDFFIEVPEIGSFRFGRRTFGDSIRIRAEYLRVIGGLSATGEKVDPLIDTVAYVIATFKVMCVSAPAGWEDLEQVDLLEHPNAEDLIYSLQESFAEKEDSFRCAAKQSRKAEGQAA